MSVLSHDSEMDVKSAALVLLPLYKRFLWFFAWSDFWEGLVSLLILHGAVDARSWFGSIFFALTYGFYHLTNEGLAYMLTLPGAGTRAARDSVRMSWNMNAALR